MIFHFPTTPQFRRAMSIALTSLLLTACGSGNGSSPGVSGQSENSVDQVSHVSRAAQAFIDVCLSESPNKQLLNDVAATANLSVIGERKTGDDLPAIGLSRADAPTGYVIESQNRSVRAFRYTCGAVVQSHHANAAAAEIDEHLSSGGLPGRPASRPARAYDPQPNSIVRYWRRPSGEILEIEITNVSLSDIESLKRPSPIRLRFKYNKQTTIVVRAPTARRPCLEASKAEFWDRLGYDYRDFEVRASCS